MDHFDIVIIGAGVVGLAIAEILSERYQNIVVIEKNEGYGQETSSRNSEVIHAGIYYPPGSLKASLCREGNHLLYDACEKKNIPHRRIGKLIVATNATEEGLLQASKITAEANGVDDLSLLGRKKIAALEPELRAIAALYSPSTGIIDSHSLMRSLWITATTHGVTVAFRSEVTSICYDGRRYVIESNKGEYSFTGKILINSAGLHSDRMAALVGVDIDKATYRLKYCKGSYFAASPSPALHHLVYPVPLPNHVGLGVHATLDLGGRVRFGPDVEYIDRLDYSVDENKRDAFAVAVMKYLPAILPEALHPDMSGIRPKLQGPGEPVRDFVIAEEHAAGFPRFINLVGIESPGLTSCLAIAKRVKMMVDACF